MTENFNTYPKGNPDEKDTFTDRVYNTERVWKVLKFWKFLFREFFEISRCYLNVITDGLLETLLGNSEVDWNNLLIAKIFFCVLPGVTSILHWVISREHW